MKFETVKSMLDATIEYIKKHVSTQLSPVLRRIEKLENTPLPTQGPRGEKGDVGEKVKKAKTVKKERRAR